MRDLYGEFTERMLREGCHRLMADPVVADCEDRRHLVQYIPFEYVNPHAKLVIVGITPGNTQISGTYATFEQMLRSGETKEEILRTVKRLNSFGGDSMKPNLLKMLRFFEFERLLGIADVAELWGDSHHLFQATSVVPNAAFKWANKRGVSGWQMFAGSFADVMKSRVYRQQFEQVFLPSVERMNASAVYVGLGPTPDAALRFCVDKGLIRADQFIGSFPHPSSGAGDQVAYFLRQKSRGDITPRNPLLSRVDTLDSFYARMSAASDAWRKVAP
ncbi:hypothetical protein [Burkholderia cenocepacia]|uniref:hypothetical protein n=1 Tax=Burkholderia cenocepacia TaxID=95486 RepID=UPI0007617EFB|nr:hypothetical protein [Burkholderia cenocepacia]KWU26302.1 hypothetical protein AS149_25255 [Burkholderia cenocepacia]